MLFFFYGQSIVEINKNKKWNCEKKSEKGMNKTTIQHFSLIKMPLSSVFSSFVVLVGVGVAAAVVVVAVVLADFSSTKALINVCMYKC